MTENLEISIKNYVPKSAMQSSGADHFFSLLYAAKYSETAVTLSSKRSTNGSWHVKTKPLQKMAPFLANALSLMRVQCTDATVATEIITQTLGMVVSTYTCELANGKLMLHRHIDRNGHLCANVVLSGQGLLRWVPTSVVSRGIDQHMRVLAAGPIKIGREVFTVIATIFSLILEIGMGRAGN